MTDRASPPSPKEARAEKANGTWTIKRILNWTTEFFQRHEIPSPRLDAEVLLAHALGEDRLSLYLHIDEPVPEPVLKTFRGLIRRRVEREPVAYITGRREFYSLPFRVTPSVLIPRPETEHLVEFLLRHASSPAFRAEQGLRILELGTGCGNLAIALAVHLPRARVFSVDLSASALAVAKANLDAHEACRPRISILQGDLFGGLHPERARFHAIVSNPPYVPSEAWEDLPPEVRRFEPRLALDGGPGGIEVSRRILAEAASYLLPGGVLVLEIGEDQGEILMQEAARTRRYREPRILEDYAGRPRVLVLEA